MTYASCCVAVLLLRLQPYVMLGLELQQRGHEVVLATEQRMVPLIKQLGQGKLGYAKLSGDPTLMLYGKRNQVNTVPAPVRLCCRQALSL
jgi:UDP:flavonoid glycosyltransferase YjiC (YdhE family)